MKKKRVLLLGNHAFVIYNFRKELIKKLLSEGYDVYLSLPYDEDKVPKMEKWGCKYINTKVDRRGKNLLNDFKLILHYFYIISKVKPDVVLTYTIKPNLYGGMVCSILRKPYINNITGLGSGFKSSNKLRSILIMLYKLGLKQSKKVFFQNTHDRDLLNSFNIAVNNHELIPGSGVNLNEYTLKKLPDTDEIRFIFVGRIMNDKGIEEYLKAAKEFQTKASQKLRFDLVGFIESTETKLSEKIKEYHNQKIVNYHGYQSDVKPFIEDVHCLIQPSHGGEGISNVLLEAAASGRILIASDIPGCKETIEQDMNGYLFKAKDSDDLIKKINKFLENCDSKSLQKKSEYSRKFIESKFDRNIVVEKYMDAITEIL